jgi:hypothetical protein
MSEKQEITVREPSQMIELAVSKGADLEKLEKLLTLQERWEANEAKKAFNKAMAEFKANPPKIEKDKTVKFNTTKWNYAPLYNIVEAITPELSKYGLSVSWRTKQNGKVVVACRISHELGHYEEIELSAESDTSGSKNPIQAIGSTISYLQRYTLLSILGLACEDMDDDGQAAATEYINDKQKGQLIDIMAEANLKVAYFCSKFGIETLDKLPASRFQQAVASLDARKKQVKK